MPSDMTLHTLSIIPILATVSASVTLRHINSPVARLRFRLGLGERYLTRGRIREVLQRRQPGSASALNIEIVGDGAGREARVGLLASHNHGITAYANDAA